MSMNPRGLTQTKKQVIPGGLRYKKELKTEILLNI